MARIRDSRGRTSTGSADLDRDLDAFFKICRDKAQVRKIKAAISNKALAKDDFEKVVPKNVTVLAFALATPAFEVNLGRVRPESRKLLRKAKALFKEHFEGLVNHPGAIGTLSEPEPAPKPEQGSQVTSLDWSCVWASIGETQRLRPRARLVFRNADGRILLDSELDWVFLSFLASTVTGVFKHLLRKGKFLAEKNVLDLTDASLIGTRIDEIEQHFEELTKLAADYGISLHSKDQTNKPSKPSPT